MNPFLLNGKNILITGASSGIGRQCALTCSEMGANVILIGRNEERLLEVFSRVKSTDGSSYYVLDLLDYSNVEKMIVDIKIRYNCIDGIVNCAGISTTLPIKLVSISKMLEFFSANVLSCYNLVKLLSHKKYMSNGGSVIFLSSVMGIVGTKGKSLYSMTKGALISMSKSLAIELANKSIRVNCISPGVVKTPMSMSSEYSKDENSYREIETLHPLGIGTTEDVANACVFLLSDASKWVTGTNIVVDGGYTAK